MVVTTPTCCYIPGPVRLNIMKILFMFWIWRSWPILHGVNDFFRFWLELHPVLCRYFLSQIKGRIFLDIMKVYFFFWIWRILIWFPPYSKLKILCHFKGILCGENKEMCIIVNLNSMVSSTRKLMIFITFYLDSRPTLSFELVYNFREMICE